MYIVKTRRCLKYRLAKEMKRGRLLDLECVPRQIGKTTLLMEVAEELNDYFIDTIIIEPTRDRARLVQRMLDTKLKNKKHKCKEDISVISIDDFLGGNSVVTLLPKIPCYKFILIDEGVDSSKINLIMKEYQMRPSSSTLYYRVGGYIGTHEVINYNERLTYVFKEDWKLSTIARPLVKSDDEFLKLKEELIQDWRTENTLE